MEQNTYQGQNIQEVLTRIKAELGEDAVIHNTRWSKKPGIFGIFGSEVVEVTASRGGAGLPVLKRERSRQAGRGLVERRYRDALETAVAQHSGSQPLTSTEKAHSGVEEEIRHLRMMMEEMQAGRGGATALLVKGLTRQGFPEAEASRLADAAVDGASVAESRSPERLRSRLSDILRDMLRCRSGLESREHSPRFYALVGPTGTGKTTTVAKLAAIYAIKRSLNVGIVSIDNYRVGGSEQIRRYAEIIGVPLFQVSDVREAAGAREAMAGRDVVLVDTTGRSPGDQLAISEMALLMREIGPDEVMLTVESGILGERAERIRMSFGRYFDIGRVIVTKIDEIPYIGAAVALSFALSAPLAYVTNGQEVPEDIRSASKDAVLRLLTAALS